MKECIISALQVECLDKKLNPLQVHVKTIDGFQGQEREIIIFSSKSFYTKPLVKFEIL